MAITAPAVPRSGRAAAGRELTNLYVLARHQGSGIGQDLLDAVLPAGARPCGSCAATRGRCALSATASPSGAEDDGSAFGIAALRMVR